MIASLAGKIQYKQNNNLIVDVNGVGYNILVNSLTFSSVGSVGEAVSIITYLDVKEDSLTLFGFLDMISFELFKYLISVNGVGAKSALAILDLDQPEAIMQSIQQERASVLNQASGIGKKTSERIILELKDKLSSLYNYISITDNISNNLSSSQNTQDVWDALESLGYKPSQIQKVLSSLDNALEVSEQIRLALKLLQK
ncbi:MAG: Holliday junction branch migration protein RuvA [Candidatus Paceibacterota bacterium]